MYKSGANTVYVNTWTPYMGANKIYSVNGDWYIDLTGKAYLHGVDINGNDFLTQHKDNPKKSSDPDNLKTRTIKITDAIAEAGFSTGNINLNNLTFTPQTITETQTANIQFTEGSNTAYVVGKTIQGILQIEVNGQSITKNISMTAAGVYQAGVNDAKANHITWTPITPTSYSNIIAKRYGNVQTYGNSNNKYIQVQFELTADHTNNDNESTYAYTIPNEYITTPATFNVDVTDLVNSSGAISVSKLSFTSASGFAGTTYDSYANSQYSGTSNSDYKITATASIKINDSEIFQNIPVDITTLTNQLQLVRYSVTVNTQQGVNGYDANTGYLYIRSNYELRLGDKTIVDWRDASGGNRVDISDYVSGSSGTVITSTSVSRSATSYNPYQKYISGSMKWVIDTYPVINDETYGSAVSLDVQDLYDAWHQSSGSASHSITKATGSNWSSTVKQYNFTVNDSNAGNVRIYKDGNTIKGAYANSSNESYSYDDLFTISSGISINDVTISSASPITYHSFNADTTLVVTNEFVNYDEDTRTLRGRAKVILNDGAGGTTQRELLIEMNGNRAWEDGNNDLYVEPSYTITNGNVTGGTYSDSDPYILPVTATFEVDGKSKSFESQVNVYYAYQAGQQSAGGSSGSYTGDYYTLIGTQENVLVNYSKVVDDLYYRYGNTYYKFDYTVYFGTPTVRYDAGDTLYLYSKN